MKSKKSVSKVAVAITYVVCIAIVVGLVIGNNYALKYQNLISVHFNQSNQKIVSAEGESSDYYTSDFSSEAERTAYLQATSTKIEEEGVVLPNGSTHGSPKVIALKGSLGYGGLVEEIPRIEVLVAQKIKNFSMPVIGTGAGGDVNDAARVAPVLGAGRGVVHFKFSHGVDRGLERNLAIAHIHQVDAVHHEVRGAFARAGGIDAERPLATNGGG